MAAGLALAACKQNKSAWSDKRTSAAAALPAQSAKELDMPLAQIDDVVITLGDFQERLNRQSPYVRARYTSLEQKKEFLDNLVRFEVMAKEALRRGFDKDPEVVRTMKQVMIQKLIAEEFDQKVTAANITEAEMLAYYNANQAEFVQPEEVRASAIVLNNRPQAERVATEAQGELGKTNKAFRDLVLKYAQDEDTKLRGGDLRYFGRDAVDIAKPVIEAGFALQQVGDVSGVVDGGNGKFYVLKLTGRKKAMTKTFEDAKGMIRNKLFRDKRVAVQEQFLAGLRAKTNVVVDEASLAKVRIMTGTGPAADDGHGHASPGGRPNGAALPNGAGLGATPPAPNGAALAPAAGGTAPSVPPATATDPNQP